MKESSQIDSLLFYLARAVSWILCRLPLVVCLWLARRMGDLAYLVSWRRGRVAYLNLKRCLGETHSPQALLRLERRAFQNLLQTAVEVLRIPSFNQKTVDR